MDKEIFDNDGNGKLSFKEMLPFYSVAYLVLFGFFVGLVYIIANPLSKTSGSYEIILVLFGALSAKFSTVVDYFFGSAKST